MKYLLLVAVFVAGVGVAPSGSDEPSPLLRVVTTSEQAAPVVVADAQPATVVRVVVPVAPVIQVVSPSTTIAPTTTTTTTTTVPMCGEYPCCPEVHYSGEFGVDPLGDYQGNCNGLGADPAEPELG